MHSGVILLGFVMLSCCFCEWKHYLDPTARLWGNEVVMWEWGGPLYVGWKKGTKPLFLSNLQGILQEYPINNWFPKGQSVTNCFCDFLRTYFDIQNNTNALHWSYSFFKIKWPTFFIIRIYHIPSIVWASFECFLVHRNQTLINRFDLKEIHTVHMTMDQMFPLLKALGWYLRLRSWLVLRL